MKTIKNIAIILSGCLIMLASCKKDNPTEILVPESRENVILKDMTVNATSITLQWEKPNNEGYRQVLIKWEGNSTQGNVTKDTSYTSCTIDNLVAETEYAFSVIASDSYGNKSDTATFSVTTTATEGLYHFIYTVDDLDAVRGGIYNGWDITNNYILMKNLDMNDWVTNDANGWTPIGGTSGSYFTGIFDGNGHTIKNLVIKRPTTDDIGLFSYTGTYSVIKNLGLVDIDIEGGFNTGGFAGFLQGDIINCYTTGKVNYTNGGQIAGGLIGQVYDSCLVKNCYTNTSVKSYGSFAGGLIGVSNEKCTISGCYALGNVQASQQQSGGLIGVCNGGTVINCYAQGNVSANDYACGGLIGYANCTITNCGATGNVTGTSAVGGLVGSGNQDINYCFSNGNVTGTDWVGGIIGRARNNNISYCYSSGIATYNTFKGKGIVGSYVVNEAPVVSNCFCNNINTVDTGATGKTPDELKSQATYTSWDFTNTWTINSTKNGGFPYLMGMVNF